MMRTDSPKPEHGVRRRRMTVAVLCMFLLLVACMVQIIRLSVTESGISSGTGGDVVDTTDPNWNPADTLHKCFIRANTQRPTRGEIYDDHGRLLVGNYNVFEVAFDGKRFAAEYDKMVGTEEDRVRVYSEAEVDTLLHQLARSFYQQFNTRFPNRSEKYYYNLFLNNYKNKRYQTIFPVNVWREKSWISGADTSYILQLPCYLKIKKVEDVKKKKITYVTRKRKVNSPSDKEVYDTLRYKKYFTFIPVPIRINPYGDMARRTLGVNMGDRHYGMEYTLNDILAGEKGSKKYLELNHAVVPMNDRIEPVDGYNVHTTLNLEIQNAVHNEMARKLQELNAEWGCAIVMETKTGEIKAISNLCRQTPDGSAYAESMEYALNAKVEPGSTFKLASLLAFLEKMPSDTDCIYPMFSHTFKVMQKSGQTRSYYKVDSKVRDEALGTPNEIFQRSSNIGIASMIFKAYGIRGFSSYRAQLEKFGLFDTIHTQMGDLMPAGIRNDGRFDNYYATCFGAGFNIPILRTLMYYNAIANDGKMMMPLFVKCVSNEYDTIERYQPEVIMENWVSERTLQKARAYLDSVVWGKYGTARHFKDPTCPFAGKTGTRDVWDASISGYNVDRNAVSFCGYFPKDRPKYTVIVYIYDVPHHSEVAVDVFAKIARSIMNSNNYSAMHNIEEYARVPLVQNRPINKRYFNSLFYSLGYDTVAYDTPHQFFLAQADTTYQLKVQTVPVDTLEGVPNVKNMIASDAVAVLTRAGYNTSINGRGVVKRQVIERSNKRVKLYLEPIN